MVLCPHESVTDTHEAVILQLAVGDLCLFSVRLEIDAKAMNKRGSVMW